MFESVDGRTHGRPLESHPISSPGAVGSGGLKLCYALLSARCMADLKIFDYNSFGINHKYIKKSTKNKLANLLVREFPPLDVVKRVQRFT